MEKCADSDFMLFENDVTKTSEIATFTYNSSISSKAEKKNKCKNCCKVSGDCKEIASEDWFSGTSEPVETVTPERTRRHQMGTKMNVLNKHVTEIARKSVQKKTKIIKSNVPDRLGKYVNYRVRSETKILLNDRKLEAKSSSCERFTEEPARPSGELSKTNDGQTKTKTAVLGNECLINEEADRLRNSFESDLETKNIFENFFDDCLDSTSNGKDASSHENVNDEGIRKKKEALEKTPEKKKKGITLVGAPVKIRDHSNYYNSHKNIRHVCAYCHKIFKSNGKLNSHVYSHTGERPFDCNHCGKAFSSKFKLVRHLLIHSEVRKFVCQICDRTFLRNDHLKNHYKVHDPQKKMYKCPKENCDKEYSSILSHKKHMAYHNVEDGDLKCLICNVKYETKEEILFHLKSHSGSRLFKSQSDKKFKCQFCDRLFLTRKDVTRHLVVHTGERDFLCQFCPQRFGRKDHLVRHIKKSHGNEDLIKNEEFRATKEEAKKTNEVKINDKPGKIPELTTLTRENDTQTEENKTHIVITVQSKTLQNRGKRKLQKKPFQKNESLVPKKTQLSLAKGKNPTTQILLQNIPNILIIPNNSIILLRNQGSNKRNEEESQSVEPEPSVPPEPEINQDLLPSSHPTPPATDFINFSYESNMFPPSTQFLGGFHNTDNFCGFQTDLPSFGSQFDEPDFEMLSRNDLLPRAEVDLTPDAEAGGNLLEDAPRETTATTAATEPSEKPAREKTGCEDIEKELFESGNDSLLLNESILNEFKDDSHLPSNDVGILGNILNQSSDNCGFELLRHLLTSENPVLSPLPGFNQIFHNTNANSN